MKEVVKGIPYASLFHTFCSVCCEVGLLALPHAPSTCILPTMHELRSNGAKGLWTEMWNHESKQNAILSYFLRFYVTEMKGA